MSNRKFDKVRTGGLQCFAFLITKFVVEIVKYTKNILKQFTMACTKRRDL